MTNLLDLVRRGADLAQLEAWLADADLGVDPAAELDALGADWTSRDLVRAPEASLTLFLLPAGAALPLHDHPGMHGVLHLLAGRLTAHPYDWDDSAALCARRLDPVQLTPGDALRVTPVKGALHALRATAPSAFVDLFVPPYGEDRVCSYYRLVEQLDADRVQLARC